MKSWSVLVSLVVAASCCCWTCVQSDCEWTLEPGHVDVTAAAKAFLEKVEKGILPKCHDTNVLMWKYYTNLTNENQVEAVNSEKKMAEFLKGVWNIVQKFNWTCLADPGLRRQFLFLSDIGESALEEDDFAELETRTAKMMATLGGGKICEYSTKNDTSNLRCNLTLEPDVTNILAHSRNPDELLHVWLSWRRKVGSATRQLYPLQVKLLNRAAKLNGFSDWGAKWRKTYEDEQFVTEVDRLWEEVLPLYKQLFTYVRRKLIDKYGADKIRKDGPIPAHLLGSLFATTWRNILNFTSPFPNKPQLDVTKTLEQKGYNPLKIFKLGDSFFTSLGLDQMTDEFWNNSLFEKPNDREIVCHASAWDFCDGKDFRIKQCTQVTHDHLTTAHHEMGHIQYFMNYAHQPYLFREGANPGFHEAIGDLIALSVTSRSHLQKIGLVENATTADNETEINTLFSTALDKIARLPMNYLVDKWRWKVFSGEIRPEELNRKWWAMRSRSQGITSPVNVTEEDFELGAVTHVVSNIEYMRYFVSYIIQFQFFQSLCKASGYEGPLHNCDFFHSKEAGDRLKEVLRMGSSRPWPEVMLLMTGNRTDKMDAGPLLQYFNPLHEWLKETNRNEHVGWKL